MTEVKHGSESHVDPTASVEAIVMAAAAESSGGSAARQASWDQMRMAPEAAAKDAAQSDLSLSDDSFAMRTPLGAP